MAVGDWMPLMDTSWFFPTVLFIAFICCVENYHWHNLRLQWANLPRTIAIYSLMFILVMFFRYYHDWFSRDRWIGASLQYIGTRTLDVYLLHFILLPQLPEVGKWLDAHHPNFVLDIVLAVGTALVIIAFCLLISEILRMSPFLKKYLFGR